ncbi:MAG: MFS transporter [Anaerolineae bacterium]|jgi:DHA1 family tetracycline resistance protein-like MFS transporter
MSGSVALVITFVFVDLLGYSLFLPLLPYYAETLGATPSLVGFLVASNALAQLLAAPVVGRLSDRIGRRPLLIFSIAGTVLSFVLLGLVEPLGGLLTRLTGGGIPLGTAVIIMLFLSRTLDGLAGGNASLARAYISDITGEKDRAKALGMIGAAFGLGFIIGPALGGLLSNWPAAVAAFAAQGLSRYAVPAFAAVALSTLNLLAVILWLPESLSADARQELQRNPRAALSARLMIEALRRPRFGALLQIRFFYMLAFTVFTANFALYTQYRLGLADQSTSYILAYVGILVVLVQGVAIGRLTRRFREVQLILAASVLLGLALIAWAFVPGVPLLLVVLVPLALGGGVLNTVTNSAITKSVYRTEVGGALGFSEALNNLARVIAPAIGGAMLDRLGASSLGILGAMVMAWVVLTIWRRLVVETPPLPGQGEGETAVV